MSEITIELSAESTMEDLADACRRLEKAGHRVTGAVYRGDRYNVRGLARPVMKFKRPVGPFRPRQLVTLNQTEETALFLAEREGNRAFPFRGESVPLDCVELFG